MIPLPRPLLGLLFAAGLLLLTSGCGPDCRGACQHLVDDCGVLRSGSTTEECIAQCQAYLEHYDDDWQREESRNSVDCVASASCEELQNDSPCYDEAVYVW